MEPVINNISGKTALMWAGWSGAREVCVLRRGSIPPILELNDMNHLGLSTHARVVLFCFVLFCFVLFFFCLSYAFIL